MKLVSINVGVPQQFPWKGKTVTTAIYKSPLRGRVHLGRLNLDGDKQADLPVYGGIDKAVYVYPAENEMRGVDMAMRIQLGLAA
jgi:MOSC domain-containing protein YiiM